MTGDGALSLRNALPVGDTSSMPEVRAPWTMDAARSAALLGRRDPVEMLRLCVLELLAREIWTIEQTHRRRKVVDVLTARTGSPDVDPGVPFMRIDALLRELSPRLEPGAGVPLDVLGAWTRARWGSRHGFLDSVVLGPMRRAGLMRSVRDRRGVPEFEPTPEGERLAVELRGRMAPFDGRRGRRLVKKDPVAALADAEELGPAVLLLGKLHRSLATISMEARVAGVGGAGGFIAVGNDGFGSGLDFGFTDAGSSGGGGGGGGDGGWDGGSGGDGGGGDGG